VAAKKFYGGGSTVYRCTRRNYKVVRRASRQAESRTDCEIDLRCLGGRLDVNFDCSSYQAFDKAGMIFFGQLDRAKAEGSLSGRRRR
jgi:hypothetical protein